MRHAWKARMIAALTRLSCILLLVTAASAGSIVQVQLTGVGGDEYGWGPDYAYGQYVMPYYVSINGASPTAVIADDYFGKAAVGETWTGIISNFSDLSLTRFGTAYSTQYHEAAWIASQLSSTSSLAAVAAAQFAIWSLFSHDVPSVPGEKLWLTNAATAAAHNYYGMNFSGWEILSPFNCASPQEYLFYEPLPEPEVLTDLGVGLLFVASCLYARRPG